MTPPAAPPMTPSSSAASSASVSAPPSATWSSTGLSRRRSIMSMTSLPAPTQHHQQHYKNAGLVSRSMEVSASAGGIPRRPSQVQARQRSNLGPEQRQEQEQSQRQQNDLQLALQKHRQPVDPLSRTFPKPEGEVDVAEALRRPPGKWTLRHWAKHSRDLPLLPSPAQSPAEVTLSFEKTKQALRQAQLDMDARREG